MFVSIFPKYKFKKNIRIYQGYKWNFLVFALCNLKNSINYITFNSKKKGFSLKF